MLIGCSKRESSREGSGLVVISGGKIDREAFSNNLKYQRLIGRKYAKCYTSL